MNFDQSFEFLIGHEGNFSNDRDDPGNWTGGKVGVGELKGTKFGISAASYPRIDIKNLTVPDAKSIYRRDFWGNVRAEELPGSLGFQVFDCAVNSGVDRAVKWLQEAVGTKIDGDFGPKTMAAVQATPEDKIELRLNGIRLCFMTECAVWPKYAKGWARRIASNLIKAGA